MEEQVKRCRKCGEEKPVSEFYRCSRWYEGSCKSCKSLSDKLRREMRKGRTDEEIYGKLPPELFKQCTSCGEIKLISEFVKHRSKQDGYASHCKKCVSTKRKKSYSRTEDEIYNWVTDTSVKVCAKCGDAKHPYKFRKNRNVASGFHSWCKDCVDEYKKRYNLARFSYNKKRFNVTQTDIRKMYEEHPYCHYCETHLEPSEVSLDHKIPIKGEFNDGYKKSTDNLVICCRDCNYLKHTRTDVQFFQFLADYRDRLNKLDLPKI